ncbi:MAG: 2OG-Fe(II) oxygenase [Balneolales bacterium]|nr:2OG-Fe(II) oxygenase [Balneolales bacterium]
MLLNSMELSESQYEQIINDLAEKDFAICHFLVNPVTLGALRSVLAEKQAEGELIEAAIGNKTLETKRKDIRRDKILWIDPSEQNMNEHERVFNARIADLSAYMNRTCFTGIREWEFHYACYEPGAFYKRHIDQFKNDDARKFSVITYLNSDWTSADGGQLVMYLNGEALQILPEFGTSVIFRSEIVEHEVLPSVRERLSITGWLK